MDNLVFVASPYRADAYETMVENQSFAIKFMRNLWERTNEVGFAPHTYFPAFLDEDDEYQRNVGIAVGLEIMKICKRMYVVGPTISEGMKAEIDVANKLGLEIIYVPNPDVFFTPKTESQVSKWPLLQRIWQLLFSSFS